MPYLKSYKIKTKIPVRFRPFPELKVPIIFLCFSKKKRLKLHQNLSKMHQQSVIQLPNP